MIEIIVTIKKKSAILYIRFIYLPWQCQCNVFHIMNYYYNISSVPQRHLGTEHFKIKDLSNFWGKQHGRSLG